MLAQTIIESSIRVLPQLTANFGAVLQVTTLLQVAFLHTCRWLRKDKELRLEEQKMQRSGKDAKSEKPSMATWSNGWTAGRMTASMKDSSNAVMRM